jgi:hypothetical protein
MTRVLEILVTTLLVSSCVSCSQKTLTAHVSNTEIIDSTFMKLEYELKLEFVNGGFYPVKIDLLNNSDSRLYFWTMSCSWQSNWVAEDKSVTLFVECPKNVPILVYIEPRGSLTHYGIIHLLDTANLKKSKEHILGFVLVKKNEVRNEIDFIPILRNKIELKKDIYWSNSFKIGK